MHPILALIIANLIWGAAPPIFKLSLEGIPPFTLAFIRFFFAGLIFLPFALHVHQKIRFTQWRDILLGAFFGITINVGFFFVGLQYAPSINMHIIGSLAPIILYVFSIYLLREKPHKQVIQGMLISFVGAAVIIFAPLLVQGLFSSAISTTNLWKQFVGNIFFLGSVLGMVFHTLIYRRVPKTINTYAITCYGFLFSSFLFFPLMLHELQSWSFSQLTSQGYIGIFYGIFFSSALAYFTYNYAVTRMPAQEVGVFSYMTPIVSVIVAIPLIHEYPDMYFVLGALLIITGIYISERKIKKNGRINKVRMRD